MDHPEDTKPNSPHDGSRESKANDILAAIAIVTDEAAVNPKFDKDFESSKQCLTRAGIFVSLIGLNCITAWKFDYWVVIPLPLIKWIFYYCYFVYYFQTPSITSIFNGVSVQD